MALAAAEAEGLRLLRFIPGYETHIVVAGKEPLLLMLLAFLIAFALTRLYTRLARVYDWGSGNVHGVHLHHMVIGIIMVLASGLVAIAAEPGRPWLELLAIAFGVGAALTLDEFALWLYFRDVYWSEEGRSSIDATIMGVVLAASFLVGTAPFGIDQAEAQEPRTVAFGVIAASVFLAAVTFLKGRLLLGVVSIFLPPVGLLCSLRLAKPRSPWARWFYRSPEKLARAHARFDVQDRRWKQLKDRLYDLIGGAPSDERRAEAHPEPAVVDGYLAQRGPDERATPDAGRGRPASGS